MPNSQVIEVGDTLSVTFFQSFSDLTHEYKFQVGDSIRLIFSYQTPEVDNVIVRPDGKITIPVIGDVVATDATPTELADRLAKIFGLPNNKVSVSPITTDTQVTTFLSTLTKYQNRSGVAVQVRTDGMLSLPLVGSVHGEGMTVEQMQAVLQSSYGKIFPNLNVDVDITDTPGRRIAVLGEVYRPGVFPITSPVNLLEAIAYGGGLLDDANYENVLLFKKVEKGYSIYKINLRAQLKNPAEFQSYFLGQQDMVYVVKSNIDDIDHYISQYVVNFLPFSRMGATAAASYTINPTGVVP